MKLLYCGNAFGQDPQSRACTSPFVSLKLYRPVYIIINLRGKKRQKCIEFYHLAKYLPLWCSRQQRCDYCVVNGPHLALVGPQTSPPPESVRVTYLLSVLHHRQRLSQLKATGCISTFDHRRNRASEACRLLTSIEFLQGIRYVRLLY